MPLEGARLVVEKSYPMADELMAIESAAEPDDSPVKVRNRFWSTRHRVEVVIFEHEGRIRWAALSRSRLGLAFGTLAGSVAWGLEQESAALHLLGGMVKHAQFKQYLLTGMFLETSRRSGLTYLFRKLRPTVVIDGRDKDAASCRVLAALCLHPIAYYEDSWAGAMCPTDDVVAHLSLMRGDEVMFWRRANQHPPWRPEAGL